MYRVPNFILAFIPAQINPNTLNTMTAFAVRPYPFIHSMTDIYLDCMCRPAVFCLTSSCTWFPIHSWANIRTEGFTLSWSKRNAIFSSGRFIQSHPFPHAYQTTNVCSPPSYFIFKPTVSRLTALLMYSELCF